MTALRRILVVLILATASLAFASTRPAWACSCAQIDDYLSRAQVAFVGVATDVDQPWTDTGNVTVEFAVETVEKGDPGTEIELTTAAQSPSCGYEFTKGHRYRVFASDGATNLCDGNEDLGLAAAPKSGAPKSGALKSGAPGSGLWTTAGAVVVGAGILGLLLYRRRRRQ